MISLGKRVQRAGIQPGPDEKPATAADGLAFSSDWFSVGADYFKTTGVPLLRGRAFTHAEETQPGGPAVAIIDEKLAKKLWPDGDALGQRIQFPSETAPAAKDGGKSGAGSFEEASGDIKPGESIEVVGIVPVIRDSIFSKDPGTAIYVPFGRGYQSNVFFFVKFARLPAGSEASTADLLRRTINQVEPALPILSLKTFEQHLEADVQLWLVRAGAALFSVFGGLALGLSVVGLYGVKAYSVARRTREIGIRMALGAQRAAVQRMILREGSAMLGVGLRSWPPPRLRHRQARQQHALSGEFARPDRLHRCPDRARRRRPSRHLAAGAPRHPHQPDGCTPHRMSEGIFWRAHACAPQTLRFALGLT